MKKRILLGILFASLFLSFSACRKTEDAASKEEVQQMETEKKDTIESSQDMNEKNKKIEDSVESKAEVSAESVMVTVYYSEDAMTFISSDVQVDTLSPEAVLEAMVNEGAVADGVQVQSFEITTVDDKQTILIDFNSAFASYISQMGATGEYYAMGSVCNTYLEAYDCEQIKITVNGELLSTGHAEYTGYLTTFS